jgi:hypothetical protein
LNKHVLKLKEHLCSTKEKLAGNAQIKRCVKGTFGITRRLSDVSKGISGWLLKVLNFKLEKIVFYSLILGLIAAIVLSSVGAVKAGKYLTIRSRALNEIQQIMNDIWNSNYYTQIYIENEKFIAFLHNKNKEAFAQSNTGGVAVFRNDGKTVSFGKELTIEYGVCPLRLIELGMDMVKKFQATVSIPDTNAQGRPDYVSYEILIKGKDKIYKLYEQVSKEYADEIMQQLFYNGSELNPKDITMKLTLVKGKNGELGGGCWLISNGKEYTSWYFDGYLKMFDWSLTKDWYSNDTSDTKKWQQLIDDLVAEVDKKTKEYADANGIDINKAGEESKEQKQEQTEGKTGAFSINGINFNGARANNVTYKEWSSMTSDEKVALVNETLEIIKKQGKKVKQDAKWFADEIEAFYRSNDKTLVVSHVIVVIGTGMGAIE